MSIDIEILCELEAIRHGHPPPATQTENDLAELCRAQGEALRECREKRREVRTALGKCQRERCDARERASCTQFEVDSLLKLIRQVSLLCDEMLDTYPKRAD